MSNHREGPDVACSAPFVAMEFDPFGNVQACCSNALYPLGNVTRASLDEIWRGARATTLRQAMVDRDFSRGCVVCRHRSAFADGEIPLDYYGQFPIPSLVPEWPELLAFSLHNTCNLECIMCGADLSSKIRSKRSSLPPLPHVYAPSFFEELRPFLAHCRSIDMAGGEPFLVREHREIWRLLAELDDPPIVSVTTNGTVWNDEVEGLLATFRMNLCVSVDGVTPETFEAVRTGASYREVMANLERFRTYAAERGTGVFLSFSMVRQNWFELGRVLLFAEERGMEVSVQTVIEQDFGVQHLPTDELAAVVAALEDEDRALAPQLQLNREAWDRQLLRLRTELDERRSSIVRPEIFARPTPGRSAEVAQAMLATVEVADPAAALDAAERHLRRWSEGRPLGTLELDGAGVVTAAAVEALLPDDAGPAAADVVGHPFTELLDGLGATVGGGLWVGETLVEPAWTEHLLWYGRGHEARDKEGLILRTAAIRRGGTTTVLLAPDHELLPRSAPTPVTIGARADRRTGPWG